MFSTFLAAILAVVPATGRWTPQRAAVLPAAAHHAAVGQQAEQPEQPQQPAGSRSAPSGRRAPAQPSRGTPGEEISSELAVVPVKHAQAADLFRIINSAFGINVTTDTRTNTLIIQGPAAKVRDARELIAQLDVPLSPAGEKGMAIVPLTYRYTDVERVANQLMNTFRGELESVVADRARSLIMMRGSPQALASAKEVIAALDTGSRSISIEASFFHASMSDSDAKRGPVPADLADVAKELERFGKVGVIGRLSTITADGEEFSLKGTLRGNMSAEMRLDGRVVGASDEGVRLEFRASLRVTGEHTPQPDQQDGKAGSPPPGPPAPIDFNLNTIVSVRPGEYVVLGSAPCGWKPGESAILVIKVAN